MTLNELIMFKVLAFTLCDNIFLRIILVVLLLLDIFVNKRAKKSKSKFINLVKGYFLIFFNMILNVNFIVVNFLVLGVASSIWRGLKSDKIIGIYCVSLMFQGAIELCIRLQ